ncbi:DUF4625 domain-containing protein [Ravibacter arvi]|uniref:DUF4625 domain-containing protein n=1 Tax=Ravibacter arvi TaxID=2051041 RepID=A0ABP8M4X5_9BACT
MKHLVAFCIPFLVALQFSCKNDDPAVTDKEPPVITVEKPVMEASYTAGSQISFEAVIEDNQELAVYQIEIHDDHDGHSHGRMAASPFSYRKSFQLTGKKATVTETIAIPADAAPGEYHFIVTAIDKANNATNFADGSTKEIHIEITEK